MLADRAACRAVFLVDPPCFQEQPIQNRPAIATVLGRDDGFHAVQRPEQIHGGRPAGTEIRGRLAERAHATTAASLKPCDRAPMTAP